MAISEKVELAIEAYRDAVVKDPKWHIGERVLARAALVAAIEAEREAWQPIETAPRDGSPVMLWLADEGFAVKALWKEYESGNWFWWIPEFDIYVSDSSVHDITHWQSPLKGPVKP